MERITSVGTAAVSNATTGTILASNPGRSGFTIQNHATNPLFVYFGSGCANLTTYSIILQGGTTTGDGKGGIFSMTGTPCYTGTISASGTGPTFTYTEF